MKKKGNKHVMEGRILGSHSGGCEEFLSSGI
jgi:hypothetical protein